MPEVAGTRSRFWFTIEECPSPSTYRLLTPASWPRCGARSRRARLARRGACPGQGLGVHSQPAGAADWRPQHFPLASPTQPGAPMLCDFGVEVTRTFETAGEVYATETPGGEAAVAVHRGPYNRLNDAYKAIETW